MEAGPPSTPNSLKACQAERMKREANRTRPRKEKNPIFAVRERKRELGLSFFNSEERERERERRFVKMLGQFMRISGEPKQRKMEYL